MEEAGGKFSLGGTSLAESWRAQLLNLTSLGLTNGIGAFRAIYLLLKILAQRARRRRNLAVVLVLTALVVSILGNALTFFYFEGPARPDLTAWDSTGTQPSISVFT